jgi:thioredoxin-dependent peroxiredoxin
VRELREFREAYPRFQQAAVEIAGVSTDTLESHEKWSRRLKIPFPLLADPERLAGHDLGLVRRLGIGGWSVELFRRATLLANRDGIVVAAWADVKIRGHADEVLQTARALEATASPPPPSTP